MQKQLLLPLPSATLPFLLSFMLLCSLAKAQTPTNDNCTSAIALTSTPDWSELAGTTQNATQSLPAITCGGSQGSADDDVWYKFTALTNRYVVHVTSTSLLNPIIDVRSGACDGTSIACADETGSGQRESLILTNLTIGNTYYIRVYGYLERGSFNITLIHTPPDNDNCSTPIQLTSSTSCNPTSATTFASSQTLAAVTCNATTGNADDDVWFEFVAVASAENVKVVGKPGFNAVVDVRAESCDGASVACADATGSGGTEIVNLTGLTIGNTYFVRVYSRGSTSADQGEFTICVTHAPPVNDECANAITLTPSTTCTYITGTTGGATQSLPAINCQGSTGVADDDVWYKFVATSTATEIRVLATDLDMVLDVRSGSCNGATIACGADYLGNGTKMAYITDLIVGNTYYIRVYSSGGALTDRGTFMICLETPPLNDECVGAVTLTPSNNCVLTTGTTVNANRSQGITDCSSHLNFKNDVWYKFTAMASAQIVTIEGIAGFDPLMDVRSGSCNGTIIGCSEIGVESKSILVLSGLSIGNTYYVRVYSSSYYPEHQGTFTICVQNPAVNDDCAGAINLSSSTSCTPTAGTTVSATQSLAGADCTGDLNNADDDVWYKFIAIATTHTVIVQGIEGVFDAMVEVRAGPCNGNVIACADATAELGTETLALSNLTIGNTYYVRVYSWDKYSYSRGSFTICVTHPCATNLAISAPITSGTVIREAIKVTANNKVSGGTVTYRAPQSVILQPGFTATTSAGTFFQAMIGGCQ